jgi:hypothetical protein
MLVLNTVVCGFKIWIDIDRTIAQQAFWAVLFIGGTVLWGLGVALGVRRTYIVTRQMPE